MFLVSLLPYCHLFVSSSSKTWLWEWKQHDTWRRAQFQEQGHASHGRQLRYASTEGPFLRYKAKNITWKSPGREMRCQWILATSSWDINSWNLCFVVLQLCSSCPERRHSILLHITEETALQWGVDHGRPQEIAGSTAGALCFLCLDGCISETPGRLSHSEPFFHICRAVTSLPLQGCHRESWAKISKSFLGNSFQKAARDTNEFHGVLTRISKDML